MHKNTHFGGEIKIQKFQTKIQQSMIKKSTKTPKIKKIPPKTCKIWHQNLNFNAKNSNKKYEGNGFLKGKKWIWINVFCILFQTWQFLVSNILSPLGGQENVSLLHVIIMATLPSLPPQQLNSLWGFSVGGLSSRWITPFTQGSEVQPNLLSSNTRLFKKKPG